MTKPKIPTITSHRGLRLSPLNLGRNCWGYEERGGISVYHDHVPGLKVCVIPRRMIAAYLRRIVPAKARK